MNPVFCKECVNSDLPRSQVDEIGTKERYAAYVGSACEDLRSPYVGNDSRGT